jgi:DNA-binding transcriptional LysR family regulator
MDLRQLRYVTEIAQSGSFIRAAEELHITQSALTRSIQAIEGELGVKLFDRGPQGAQPTQEGKMFIDVAEQVRLMLGGLRHDIDLSKKGHLGKINFGLGPMVAAAFLTDVFAELVNDYPRLELRASVNNSDRLREDLLAEHLEFFVHTAGTLAPDPRIEVTSIGDLPIGFFVRQGHPLAKKKIVTREDLSAFPLLGGTAPQLFRGVDPLVNPQRIYASFTCDDMLALKQIVQQTDGVLLTSRAMMIEEYHRGTIVELRREKKIPMLTANIAITSLKGRKLSPSASLAVQTIRKHFERVNSLIASFP